MCGLLGFITEKPSKEHAKDFETLLDYMQIRGSDATGVLVHRPWRKPGNGPWLLTKQAVAPDKFIETSLPDLMVDIGRSPLTIGHVRAKTIGSPDKPANNHPVEGKKYMLTHNGTVASTDRIKDYPYKGEVDTELIVAQLEENGFEGLKNVCGTAAIVFIDTTINPSAIYIWTHNQTMYVGTTIEHPRTVWWSSTAHGIELIARRKDSLFFDMTYAKVPDDELFKIELANKTLKVSTLGEIVGKASSYGYGRTDWQNRSGTHTPSGATDLPIEPLQSHHLEDFEEGIENLYALDVETERFVLDEKYIRENNIKPWLGTKQMDEIEYYEATEGTSVKWPREYLSFDPHNWRVVNRASGIQAMAIVISALGEGQ